MQQHLVLFPAGALPQQTLGDARGASVPLSSEMAELRKQNKCEHVMQFAAVLPALRARVAADMKLGAGDDREPSEEDAHPRRQRRVRREKQVVMDSRRCDAST
jgi:hypothetical protein